MVIDLAEYKRRRAIGSARALVANRRTACELAWDGVVIDDALPDGVFAMAAGSRLVPLK